MTRWSRSVTELRVGEWVELRGWVDDDEVSHLYSTATALAIPSLAEGFSLPALEAMSAGVPVLLSDIDVHRYVGGDGGPVLHPAGRREPRGRHRTRWSPTRTSGTA